jgi:hypothetical protein
MAEVDVAKVVVRRMRTTLDWYAVSYGANGEKIAWTEGYKDKRDAEAAALTIAAGAEIYTED